MGQSINIPTSGTQCIGAYLARPAGKSKGGIVVIQEIFGVTAHIRDVADRFAEQGYTAIAPAFCAFFTLMAKPQAPRLINATLPLTAAAFPALKGSQPCPAPTVCSTTVAICVQ